MTTLAESEPCGECGPCRVQRQDCCARVLKLDAKDKHKLARLMAIAGSNPGRGSITMSRGPDRPVREKPEPTEAVLCVKCNEPFEVLAYLVNFHCDHYGIPMWCDECRNPTSQQSLHWSDR